MPWAGAGGSLPRARYLVARELGRLLAAVERVVWPQHRAKYRTLFLLLANLGPRISELLAVRVAAVDLGLGAITLPTLKRWRTLPDGRRERIPLSRTLALSPELVAELDLYLRVEGLGPADPLFPRTRPKYVWEVFKRALHVAGLPRQHRLHDLRHSAATYLAEQTRDPMLVRDVLGHASIATSNIYLHTVNMREKLLAVPPVLPADPELPYPPPRRPVYNALTGEHEAARPAPRYSAT